MVHFPSQKEKSYHDLFYLSLLLSIHVYNVFIINFIGQKLASSETCNLQMGCTVSDFDCWYACKLQYPGGKGGCTNKDSILSRPTLLPLDDDSGVEEHCCHCLCKFESKPNESCPAPSPTVEN